MFVLPKPWKGFWRRNPSDLAFSMVGIKWNERNLAQVIGLHDFLDLRNGWIKYKIYLEKSGFFYWQIQFWKTHNSMFLWGNLQRHSTKSLVVDYADGSVRSKCVRDSSWEELKEVLRKTHNFLSLQRNSQILAFSMVGIKWNARNLANGRGTRPPQWLNKI